MADLEDEGGDVPGASPVSGGLPTEAGGVPTPGMAQGTPQEPVVEVGRQEVDEKTPREIEENVALTGNPAALSLASGNPEITERQRAIAIARLTNPTAPPEKLAELTGTTTRQVAAALAAPAVRRMMAPILDRHNAGLEECAKAIGEALKAEKKTYVTWEGAITAERADPDHKTRLDAAELGMKGHGALDNKDTVSDVHVTLTDEALAKIAIGVAKVSDFLQRGPK